MHERKFAGNKHLSIPDRPSIVMKYLVYALMGLLIISVALAKTAYGQETWYLGEGVQKGLLVKYKIATFDYLQSGGSPFDATIWFGAQDDKGDWVTDVIIEEGGRVVTNKLTLSAFNLTPLGLDYSDDFRPYKSAIRNSLGWLGDYTNSEHPRPLTGNDAWGVVGAIGGGSIIVKPTGTETLQAAGQSWDTSIIGFHYARDSQIWVKDGFPFPIKAKVYTIATQEPLPVQFEFSLMETRMSETSPPVPAENIKAPTSPVHQQTTSGAYSVDLYWKPEMIEPGQPITMGVVFFNRQGSLINDAQYDIMITDAKGNAVLDKKAVLTTDGQGTQVVTFDSAGRVHVTVTFLGSSSIGFEQKVIEKAEFDLLAVPEFPLGTVAVMGAVIAMIVAVTRFKNVSIPRL